MAPPADPRLDAGTGVNDSLQNELIKRAILLLGVQQSEALRMRRMLVRELNPRLLERLQIALAAMDVADGRLRRGTITAEVMGRFIPDLRELLRRGLGDGYLDLKGRLRELAGMQVDWASSTLDRVVPVRFDVRRPPPAELTSIITQEPTSGRTIRDWFRDISADSALRIEKQVQTGISNHERLDQVVRRVRGTVRRAGGPVAKMHRQVESMTRTAVAHVGNRASESVWSANSDVIGGLRVVATLDLRTCPICGALDGRVFPLDEGPRSPFHPSCRCVMTPVTKSWDELGLRVKRRNRGPASAMGRAAMDGRVPVSVEFPEWIRGRKFSDLVEVFGRTRAEWIRDGKIDPRELIDSQLRILRLEELRARV